VNHPFHLAGIVLHGKGRAVLHTPPHAQDIAGAEKRVSMLRARKGDYRGDPCGTRESLPNYRIRSMAEYMSLMTSSNLPI